MVSKPDGRPNTTTAGFPLALAGGALIALLLAGYALLFEDGDAPREAVSAASAPAVPVAADEAAAPPLHVPEKEVEAIPVPAAPPSAPPAEETTEAAGSLLLQFADEGGAPVPGVAVAVVHPDGVESAPVPSDADGVARFPSLAEGAGYRWRVLAPAPALEIVPPHESAAARFPSPHGREATPDWVTDLSGSFAIGRGEEARFAVRVFLSTGIRGTVALQRPQVGPLQIRILTRRDHPTTYRDDREVLVEGQAFHVTGIAPGPRKRAVLVWREEGDHYTYAKFDFPLAEGETRDLGFIGPAYGTTLDVETAIEVDGVETDVAPLLQPGFVAASVVGIGRVLRFDDPDESFFNEWIEVELGRSLHLHGLEPGTWNVDVHARFQDALVTGVRLERDHAGAQVTLEPVAECRLVLAAGRPVPLEVEVVFPFGEARVPVKVLAVSETGRRAGASVPLGTEGHPMLATLELSMGRWTLVATSHRYGAESASDLFGEATIDVTPESSRVALPLRLGRTVTGTARATGGDPRALEGRALTFTLAPFTAFDPPPVVYSTRASSDGRFALHGVPLDRSPTFLEQRGVTATLDP